MKFKKVKRPINKVIVHCSATPTGRDVDAEEIRKYHLEKKYNDIGYHTVIKIDGTIEEGRPLEKIGAHTYGKNTGSIGICLVGGVNKDMVPEANFTDEQYDSLYKCLQDIIAIYPKIKIYGHRHFANKACPSFDVGKFLSAYKLDNYIGK